MAISQSFQMFRLFLVKISANIGLLCCFKVYNVHELGPNCNVGISDPADMADCQLSRVRSIFIR